MSVDTLEPVDQLEPIELEELLSIADLQARTDRKYLVPEWSLAGVLRGLDARVLEIDGARSFAYESVYFDTPGLASYLGTARRRARRFKVRTRTYLDSGECMLEVKTRDARGRTLKHRAPHPIELRRELPPTALAFVRTIDAAAASADLLHPALTTSYRRTTLVLDGAPARVTIDVGATFAAPDGREVALDEVALVETKTAGPPCAADRLLWRDGRRPVPVSKYGTGLAALRADLPANRWHRVLVNHFPGSPRSLAARG